jgi:hypothetical protein
MTNGIGRVGWRNFVSAAPTSSYLLDNYGGASTAYSLRKLSSTYTGNAIRVRRSSDNTEQNIGFDANGNLDTTSLLSFVGAGNGFVTIWYDQSGNTNNMLQTTANLQPKIVSSGVVNTTNSKPSIRFQSSGLYNTQPTFSAPISIFSVINNNSTSGSNYFIYSNANTTETYGTTIGLVNSGWRIQSAGGGVQTYGLNSGEIFGSKVISTVMASNSAWDLFLNNTESFNSSIVGGSYTLNALGYRSNGGGTFYSDYDLRETIVYPSDKRTSRSGINSNINTYYSLYSTYTSRTTALIAATGLTDTAKINAINTFDLGLISANIPFGADDALYLGFLGDSVKNKYNFIDTSKYQLTFYGGWDFTNGMKGNSVNTYAKTGWIPSARITNNDAGAIGAYLRNDFIHDKHFMGVGSAGSYFNPYPYGPGIYPSINDANVTSYTPARKRGGIDIARTSSTNISCLSDLTTYNITQNFTSKNGYELYIGAMNYLGVSYGPCNNDIVCAYISANQWTQSQQLAFSALRLTMLTTLGLNV